MEEILQFIDVDGDMKVDVILPKISEGILEA